MAASHSSGALDATPPKTTPAFWQTHPLAQVTVQEVTAQALNTALADDIAQRLRTAIASRGVAVLSVSGGKSPVGWLQALRTHALDWSRVRVTLLDERCVPTTHPDSNACLVRTHLLQGPAQQAQLVEMWTDDASLPASQAQVAGQALVAAGACDVLVLGMGADGHTASLFPEAPNLSEALDMHNTHACVAVELPHPPVNAPYPRISQTLSQILRARHIVLPISGADKRQTLEQAWPSASLQYPVSYVLHQTQTPVALWLTA
jgi:6-phosphogluconolactonase